MCCATLPFLAEVQRVIASGELGQLVAIDIHENVAHWHYAHSFVRGNWRHSPPAAPFLLAKSCHDLDLLRREAAPPTSLPRRVAGFSTHGASRLTPLHLRRLTRRQALSYSTCSPRCKRTARTRF